MSLSISVVLFDVDGTIVDSAPAVIGAFRETLSDYGLPIPDNRRLRTYVGPPLWHSFGDLGYEGEQLSDLVAGYRRRYFARYLDPEPFPGVIELLRDLHDAGIPPGHGNVKASSDCYLPDRTSRSIQHLRRGRGSYPRSILE